MNDTTMLPDAALADLGQLRAIAEAGRRLPLVGGRVLMLWGSVVATASLLHGLVAIRALPLMPGALPLIWLGAVAIGLVAGRRLGRLLPTPSDPGNRVEQTVWQSAGIGLAVLALGLFGQAAWRQATTGDAGGFALLGVMPAATFMAYATALFTAAAAGETPELRPFAWAALAFVVPAGLLALDPAVQLVAAAGIALVVAGAGRKLRNLELGRTGG